MCGGVSRSARCGTMLAFKNKTCKLMVEGCRIEPHDSKGSAKVFLVTCRACARVLPGMVTGPCGNPLAQLGVAREAPLARNGRFAELMAIGAFIHPFECRMGGGEFPGRDLPVRWRRRAEQHHDHYG